MSRDSSVVDVVVARARWVLAVVVGIVLIAGTWGLGVVDELSLGGYSDPGSESARVDALVESRFGRDIADIAVIYTPTDGRTVGRDRGRGGREPGRNRRGSVDP